MICVSDLHPQKVLSSIDLTDDEILISSSDRHPRKVWFPIAFSELPNVTRVIFLFGINDASIF